jgi:flagellar hook-associated protein 3 FlgL
MNEKIKELGDILNTTYGGKYMFGGTSVDEPPIKRIENPDGTVTLQFNKDESDKDIPNTGDLKADISDGINIDYNVSVGEIFNVKIDEVTGKVTDNEFLNDINNLSKYMNEIATGKRTQDDGTVIEIDEEEKNKVKEKLLGTTKENIDKLFNHALDERTSLGVRVSTAEKVRNLNDDNILNMKGVLSLDQDVDHIAKFIELKSAELVYQASIQVGTKLIQPTILDYMR